MNTQEGWEPRWMFIVLGAEKGSKRVRVLFGYDSEDDPIVQVLRGTGPILREVTLDEFDSMADDHARQLVQDALEEGARERKNRLPRLFTASEL